MVLPLILDLMILAAWVCVCACVCLIQTTYQHVVHDSQHVLGAAQRSLLPSHKLRSALNLESFTVQPQLSSQP